MDVSKDFGFCGYLILCCSIYDQIQRTVDQSCRIHAFSDSAIAETAFTSAYWLHHNISIHSGYLLLYDRQISGSKQGCNASIEVW